MRRHEGSKASVIAQPQSILRPRMLLHLVRNKTLEGGQFRRVSGLRRAPGIGKKCRSFIQEAAGVHAGAIPDALAVVMKNAPDIRMPGARSVGEVEHAVLL